MSDTSSRVRGGHLQPPRRALPETESLLVEWVLWMHAGAMSRRTIDSRVELVRLFEGRVEASAVTCTWKQLATFFAGLVDYVSPGTRSTYFNHLRQWFKWLVLFDHRIDDPTMKLHPPKTPRRYPRPISTSQLRQALESGRFYGRTRAMILLGAYQGLRVHEIAKIRGEDFMDGTLTVVGKGGVEAMLPVHPFVAELVASYPTRGWWFPSPYTPGAPLTSRNVSRVVGGALRRAGVNATPHQLRHFYGTEVHRASGGNLRVAQELLRHASPATTALYTRVDDSQRRAAVMAMPDWRS